MNVLQGKKGVNAHCDRVRECFQLRDWGSVKISTDSCTLHETHNIWKHPLSLSHN